MSINIGDLVEIIEYQINAGGQMQGLRGVVAEKRQQNRSCYPYRYSLTMLDGSRLGFTLEEPKIKRVAKAGKFNPDDVSPNPFWQKRKNQKEALKKAQKLQIIEDEPH